MYVNIIYLNNVFCHLLVSELVPSDLQLELRNLYISMCELLRHFYACFPPTTPQLEEKVVKMYEAINRFHATRLTPFEVILQFTEYINLLS